MEAIDLYQFHWPDENTGTPVEESWGVMADLVAEGKVRLAGVSNFDVALLERIEPIMHVDSLQPPFNAIQRGVAAAEIPWCADNGTGVIAYSPMMSGLLTGRFSKERMASLDEGDWRRGFPEFRGACPRRATSPSRTRCGRSPSATAPRSPPSRSRGPSHGPG